MKTITLKILVLIGLTMMLFACCVPAYAEETNTENITAVTEEAAEAVDADQSSAGDKAWSAAIAIGLAAAAGAIGMGMAIAKSVESISRQPEAGEKIRTSLMLGLVFVETAIIYALIVAILIIFVL